ncbi:MAG: arsenite efflux transporter metallochaperone ArsD [Anaerolineae bacterium]
MSESIGFDERPSATPTTSVPVEIFDPPLCCPTGMCGPTIDPVILDVNEMIVMLENEGIHVARYQMASHAQAFVNNREVFRLIREKQLAALPITVVRGQILQVGAYATLAQVRAALNGHENS